MNVPNMKIKTTIFFLLTAHVLVAQQWEKTWENSVARATAENKKIVLVFSGSDWCIPCIRLENEVWKSTEFQSFASDNLVLFRADFPKRKKNKLPEAQQAANDRLADQYNPKGYFPLVLVFSPDQQLLGSFAYEKKSVKDYIDQIAAL